MKAMILIPTYNEASTVVELLTALSVLRDTRRFDFDVTVIDDNSPDRTDDIVESLALDWVSILKRERKDGLGNAYRAGFAQVLANSQYDQLVTMDADGSHRVADLPAMFAAISPGKSIVLGTRWMPGGSVVNWPKSRQLLSKSGTKYASFALGIKLADLTGGFRIYSRQLLESLNLTEMDATGYCFQIEMTRRALSRGGSVAEVPITFIERSHGQSKMSAAIALEAVVRITAWGALRLIGR